MAGKKSGGKTGVMVFIILACLGAAGIIGFRQYSEKQLAASIDSAREEARGVRQKLAAAMSRTGKYGAVRVEDLEPEKMKEPKAKLEISGTVSSQEDLDALKKIIDENKAGVEVSLNVTIAAPPK
jgi:predicted negative regulator of RcsB-dependent stress response